MLQSLHRTSEKLCQRCTALQQVKRAVLVELVRNKKCGAIVAAWVKQRLLLNLHGPGTASVL